MFPEEFLTVSNKIFSFIVVVVFCFVCFLSISPESYKPDLQ